MKAASEGWDFSYDNDKSTRVLFSCTGAKPIWNGPHLGQLQAGASPFSLPSPSKRRDEQPRPPITACRDKRSSLSVKTVHDFRCVPGIISCLYNEHCTLSTASNSTWLVCFDLLHRQRALAIPPTLVSPLLTLLSKQCIVAHKSIFISHLQPYIISPCIQPARLVRGLIRASQNLHGSALALRKFIIQTLLHWRSFIGTHDINHHRLDLDSSSKDRHVILMAATSMDRRFGGAFVQRADKYGH